jgi:hypothetical protein
MSTFFHKVQENLHITFLDKRRCLPPNKKTAKRFWRQAMWLEKTPQRANNPTAVFSSLVASTAYFYRLLCGVGFFTTHFLLTKFVLIL